MLTWTIILFGVAALGGIALAVMHFRNRPLSMPLALIHGAVAATESATASKPGSRPP